MKTLKLAAILLILPAFVKAADKEFSVSGGSDENVILNASDTGLAYNRNYQVSPGSYRGKRMSASVTYTSTTYSNVTFSTNSYTIGAAGITALAHGHTLGLPVLFTKTAGTSPAPLVDQTTYFAIPYSANVVYVATTAAKALANDPILFSSKTLTGATQTYTLSALALAGTPSFKWQGSNDGSTWTDLNTASTTVTSYTLGGATDAWDLDYVNFANYRLAIISPTQGGLYINSYIDLVR